MPAHIVLPHIDHENVSEAEDEERRLPLERLGRLAALDRVGAQCPRLANATPLLPSPTRLPFHLHAKAVCLWHSSFQRPSLFYVP